MSMCGNRFEVTHRAEETEDMVRWTQKILAELFKNNESGDDKTTTADRWSTIFDSVRMASITDAVGSDIF
jgi:hypothetical protein